MGDTTLPRSQGVLQITLFKLFSIFEIADMLLGPALNKSINKIRQIPSVFIVRKITIFIHNAGQTDTSFFSKHIHMLTVTVRDFGVCINATV